MFQSDDFEVVLVSNELPTSYLFLWKESGLDLCFQLKQPLLLDTRFAWEIAIKSLVTDIPFDEDNADIIGLMLPNIIGESMITYFSKTYHKRNDGTIDVSPRWIKFFALEGKSYFSSVTLRFTDELGDVLPTRDKAYLTVLPLSFR